MCVTKFSICYHPNISTLNSKQEGYFGVHNKKTKLNGIIEIQHRRKLYFFIIDISNGVVKQTS